MAKRKSRIIILAVCMMAVISVGSTLAYLHFVTETATNTFASDKSISLQLREPGWDGYTFADAATGNGTVAKDPSNMALGVNQAKRYVPGQKIPKDPKVKNSGMDESIYTAIKVQYFSVDSAGNETQLPYDEFQAKYLADTGLIIHSDWDLLDTQADGSQIYLYGAADMATPLAVGATTPALFDTVPLDLDIAADENGLLPKFQIKVTAYAIQEANVDAAQAGIQLLEFIG